MTKEAHDFLMGTGVPSAKFPEIGAGVVGEVTNYEKTQQRDIDGNPKTWDDGSPMWQVVITLQTEENDPAIEFDDGMRKLYAKANMLNAIRDAVRKTGYRGELVGGKLGVKYVQNGEAKRGRQAPKIYAAKFAPPLAADVLGEPEPADAPAPAAEEDFSEEPF